MANYCVPELPSIYWVNRLTYKCEGCGFSFDVLIPNGDYIIKLREYNGNEIRWMPTYDKGGYLELMTKIIKGHKLNDPVDMRKAEKFIVELQKYIEKSASGNGFGFCEHEKTCTKCKSPNIRLVQEDVLVNPTLKWLKINYDLLNSLNVERFSIRFEM